MKAKIDGDLVTRKEGFIGKPELMVEDNGKRFRGTLSAHSRQGVVQLAIELLAYRSIYFRTLYSSLLLNGLITD